MKHSNINPEHGQALILIVFAIVGLIGLTALAVDGGNAYSDRRHAQNAADTGAFAAALAKVRDDANWKQAALDIATQNGYADTDPTITSSSLRVNVEVYGCDDPDPIVDCGPAYDGNDEYIQVRITSIVDTLFAPVVGIQQVTNRVNSITRARPEFVDPSMLGNAMVSLMDGCKGDYGWNHDPFTISGNSTSIVGGSGIFVNSDCDGAFNQNGGATLTISDPGDQLCVIGEDPSYAPGTVNPPPANCGTPMNYPPPIMFPNPSCDINLNGVIDPAEEGSITEISSSPRVYQATPGYYSGSFPSASPSGKLIMTKGVYCIENDFDLHSTWEITTDVNDSGTHEDSEGVLIYVENGGITLNGSSSLDIHAMSDPNIHEDLQNLLFFLPMSNDSAVTLNGSSGSSFTGSIWAPASHISLEGSSTSYDVNSQIMGFTISTSGTADINVYFDAGENHVIKYPPSIELTE